MAGYWLKVYTEIINDYKYHQLTDAGKVGLYEALIIAKDYDREGVLPCVQELAFRTRRTVEWWQAVLDELRAIEFVVTNGHDTIIRKFSERQAPTDAKTRAKMSREIAHRNEFKAKETAYETHADAYETHGDIEIEKEIDTDTEKEICDGGADAPAAVIDPEFYVYSKITGFTSFPGAWVKATDNARLAIRGILMEKRYDKQAAIDYLMPFWEEYRKRNLPPSQFHWLDWAVTGTIPALRAPPGKAKQKPAEIDPKEYM